MARDKYCIRHGRMCDVHSDDFGVEYHIQFMMDKDDLTTLEFVGAEPCHGPFEEVPPPPSLDEGGWSILLSWVDTMPIETEAM